MISFTATVTAEGNWIVIPQGDAPPLTACPCCAKPFATKRAAVLCAEAIYGTRELGKRVSGSLGTSDPHE